MNKPDKIFVAGHNGLVGSAVVRKLHAEGYINVCFASRDMFDLTRQDQVEGLFRFYRPEHVFLCAAKVGGIVANDTFPADFIGQNLKIQTNVIDAAYRSGVKKLLFAASGCIYPRDCPQPIKEDYLLTGSLEKTNEAYAIAKIAGVKMCEFYRKQYGFGCFSVMPANVYGPGDNFSLEISHVVPALLRKFSDAVRTNEETVTVWGSGMAKREFLHVDDLASAMVFLMQQETKHDLLNIGTGEEKTIADLAVIMAEVTGFKGKVVYDSSKPDGTPRKLLDCSRIADMGWRPSLTFAEGLKATYGWYMDNYTKVRL